MATIEQLDLLERAKSAYYSGNPIMGDEEYDALERAAGLENASDIGAHSESYTVKHPFIMGSLSKIQVKNDDGKSDTSYLKEIHGYVAPGVPCEVTPKYDGCSFELVVTPEYEVVSCSTRGDGTWGADIMPHVRPQVTEFVDRLAKNGVTLPGTTVIRGEVLVRKEDYEKFLTGAYVNTRAFVAGSLNSDEVQDTDAYLRLVMYAFHREDGTPIPPALFGALADCCVQPLMVDLRTGAAFRDLYNRMCVVRANGPYPLDGFVLKTETSRRGISRTARPKDCVAVKFAPEIRETTIKDIIWNLSPKTAEYFPVGIIREITMDSKKITRVSLANYGNILKHGYGIGAKIRVSMAGDIIPYVYGVIAESRDIGAVPENTYVSGVHLYRKLSDEEQRRARFLASADALGIKGLGPATAANLWEAQSGCSHVFEFDFDVYASVMKSKSALNIRDAFRKFVSEMSLAQVVESLAIPFCGSRMSHECAAELLVPGSGNFASMAREGYAWVLENLSENKYRVFELLRVLDRYGYDVSRISRVAPAKPSGTVKVILTGSPKPRWNTKAEFLAEHPEYEETSSWSECGLLVCDDLSSTSSKMKKAAKLNIKITTYENA